MRQAILLVSPQLLLEMYKAPGTARTFEVFDHAIPADATLVDVKYINSRNEIALVLESETFNEVPAKAGPPVLSTPQCRLIYASDPEAEETAADIQEETIVGQFSRTQSMSAYIKEDVD